MSPQFLVATICLLAFLTGHSFATPDPDPQYYESFQNVTTIYETAGKLLRRFLRTPYWFYRYRRCGLGIRRGIMQDAVVILDGSGSVSSCEFDKAKQALKNVLDLASLVATEPNKYAAVTFGDDATTHFNFVANPEAGKQLQQIPYPDGSTNTQAGLKEAKRLFEDPSSGKRPGATKVVFLVTDGQSNVDSSMTIPNANLLKNSGVEIFVVAVGNYISGIEELVKVASPDPKEHVFRVANMSSFLNVTELAFDLVVPRLSQFIASHYQPLCN